MKSLTPTMNDRKEQGLINDTQLITLEQVSTAFIKWTEQINKKYKNYFDLKILFECGFKIEIVLFYFFSKKSTS